MHGAEQPHPISVRAEQDDPDITVFFRLLLLLVLFVGGTFFGLSAWLDDRLTGLDRPDPAQEEAP